MQRAPRIAAYSLDAVKEETKSTTRMIRTIARYGARHVPGTTGILIKTLMAGRAVQGPSIAEFERSFAAYHGMRHAVAASCGRMAFHYILKALNLPPQSEILYPALTFWV